MVVMKSEILKFWRSPPAASRILEQPLCKVGALVGQQSL
jgi:hypothetical protein